MEHLGPGDGREKSPEELAQEIIDSSDEGSEDFFSGTEITDGDQAYPDTEDFDDDLDYSGDYEE